VAGQGGLDSFQGRVAPTARRGDAP
jgi:hypothetical protein